MYKSKYGIQLNWTRVHFLLQLNALTNQINNELEANVAFISHLNNQNNALQQAVENKWALERARNVRQERGIAILRKAVREFKDALLQVNIIAHNAATATHCGETSSHKTLLLLLTAVKRHFTKHFYCSSLQRNVISQNTSTAPHYNKTSAYKILLLLVTAIKRHLTKHFYCSSPQ